MNEPYRREVPSSRRLLERELALEVQPAPAVPVLQMPVAGPRRRVLEEVAAVARQGARQRRGVPGLDERRLRQPQLGFELASVEFHGEARVYPIALLLEHDPVGPAQNAPQLVQGDVEVVLALGGRGVTPQREPDLLAGAAPRMTQQVEQQLARLGVAPGGIGKSLAVH